MTLFQRIKLYSVKLERIIRQILISSFLTCEIVLINSINRVVKVIPESFLFTRQSKWIRDLIPEYKKNDFNLKNQHYLIMSIFSALVSAKVLVFVTSSLTPISKFDPILIQITISINEV